MAAHIMDEGSAFFPSPGMHKLLAAAKSHFVPAVPRNDPVRSLPPFLYLSGGCVSQSTPLESRCGFVSRSTPVICVSRPHAPERAARARCRAAHCHHFLTTFPHPPANRPLQLDRSRSASSSKLLSPFFRCLEHAFDFKSAEFTNAPSVAKKEATRETFFCTADRPEHGEPSVQSFLVFPAKKTGSSCSQWYRLVTKSGSL